MLGNRGRTSHQCNFRDLAEFHNIVRDQTVTAAYELQRRLTLSDTGIAHNQHTLAVDIDQNAVNRKLGRKLGL